MKTYKHKALLVLAVIIGGVILSVGNGCSKSFTSTPSSSSNDGSASESSITGKGNDSEIIPGARTVSIVYAKQVVDQLSSCSGLAKPSDATLAMYEAKKGSISTYGAANTITSPMMMAVTSIAGEICNDLINQELTRGPRLFVGFDMASTTAPDATLLGNSIKRMALSCWQRHETSTERQMLLQMVSSTVGVPAAEAAAGRKSALMICTAMLSSLDSLMN
jgi:hypothetical protein